MEKERRTKALLLSTLVVVVATLSIAFAAMSRTLNINGIGKMDTASWSVYFANLSEATTVRGAKEEGKPNISVDKGTIENIKVKLSNPKDEISYTVDIVNDGTIDAEITLLKDIELTDAQKKIFEFKVTYVSTGDVVKNGDLLPKDSSRKIRISIRFKDDIEASDLPSQSQTINLSYQITYTQYDGSEVIVGPNGDVTREKTVLAGIPKKQNIDEYEDLTVPFLNCSAFNRDEVESVSFLNNVNVPADAAETMWDASEAGDNSIIGWYQDTDSNGLYEVYIGSLGNIYAPSDSTSLFGFLLSLKELNLNNFYTSDVTDMTYMFIGCIPLQSLDVSKFDTSKVTNMYGMFMACEALTYLDVSNFNTSQVTNMYAMFSGCESLGNIDVSNWITSNVTDMQSMFSSCSQLNSLNVNNWNTEKVTTMEDMFRGCSALTNLNLSSFTTSLVTHMDGMFSGCEALVSLDLRNADFTNVIDIKEMFGNVNSSLQIIVKDETQRTWLSSKTSASIVLPSEL